ncbi:Glucose--fructose oxidoreductase precursor [Novipirellula galeiformis]|uniref:Glucose--fructose oxidoreductase n=1 Tax=Novipirellula galeiformis TaxID=2528004 RepID=A0A5C6CPF1_9BACT|nr:Glucose--fructose oxidoreductase precursor [Novipirellula galeiformis]
MDSLNRRDLLRNAALTGVGVYLSSPSSSALSASPNEKLNIACVGLGNQGQHNLGLVQSQNIVALCDVDDERTAMFGAKYPAAKRFADFRVMLDKMSPEIDAVVVTTPNHTHATIAVAAMKAGKHCYCEKPLAHSIHEVREMQRVATEQNVVSQMGTQNHAGSNYRRVVELVQSGAIGAVRKVHVWFGRPGGWRRFKHLVDRPTEKTPIPKNLNWDLWVGPAPMQNFHPVYHPHDWHYWWDFGNGTIGNMACHYLDLVFWALNLSAPTAVEAVGPKVHPDSTPFWLECHWQFPQRQARSPVEVVWHHGRGCPQAVQDLGVPAAENGVLFVGDDGLLMADYDTHALLPENQFRDFTRPEPTIPESIGCHRREWFEACKGNGQALCDFDYAAPLTETVLLGNIAFRVGGKIQWDSARMTATNTDQVDRYLQREYRKGWTL